MSLRPADALGLPVPDLEHIALFRCLLLVLVLAWVGVVARAKPSVAVACGALVAIVSVGFWEAALARPYGLLVDPVVTARVAECAVASVAGGPEGAVAAHGVGAWLGRHGVSPATLMFLPARLAPLFVALGGTLLYVGWSRRDRAWIAALLWLAFPTGYADGLSGEGVLPGLWAHPLGALGLLASLVLALLAVRNPRGRRWIVLAIVLVAAWAAGGLFWARLGEPVTPLAALDRVWLVTVSQGVWLPLGWYGLIRRGEPASRSLALAGFVLLLVPLPASVRLEPWGPYALYRLGLLMGAAAPAAELCALAGAALKRRFPALAAMPDVRLGAAAALLVLAPASFAVWWNPVKLDPVFAASVEPVPGALVQAAEAVRAHTTATSVVIAEREYAAAIPALAGRRVRVGHVPGARLVWQGADGARLYALETAAGR